MADDPSDDLNALIEGLKQDLNERPVDVDLDLDAMDGGDTPDTIPAVPASKTALKLDDWSIRRGMEWSTTDATRMFDEFCKEHPDSSREHIAADMLSVAWEPRPQTVEKCVDDRRLRYLEALVQTPDYQRLHEETKMDNVASELAALKFAQGYFELVAQPEAKGEMERDAQYACAASGAAKDAGDDVESLAEAKRSMGGVGEVPGQSMGADEVKRIYNKIRSNKSLRRIMEMSGRYRRMAKALQHSKAIHGPDEIVDLKLGNDLSRMLRSQMVLLTDEDLEIEFGRRFVERSLTIHETRSVVSESRGPIVIIVDESGSMSGDPVANAKAMALSILWIAEHQKRWCCLVGFSGGTEGNFLVVPPGKREIDKIMDWLGHFYGGGTTMDVPLETLPKQWKTLGCPEGTTDIIQITDARVSIPPRLEKSFLKWKQEHEVRMNTIVIGDEPGDLARVSDRVWKINELNLESEGVKECLSI